MEEKESFGQRMDICTVGTIKNVPFIFFAKVVASGLHGERGGAQIRTREVTASGQYSLLLFKRALLFIATCVLLWESCGLET